MRAIPQHARQQRQKAARHRALTRIGSAQAASRLARRLLKEEGVPVSATMLRRLRVLSRPFGIRHQDGRRRRIQNFHVDPRHGDPRLHGRRHSHLAAWFAITINVQTGQPLVGALLFPVGFIILNLLGFDLLTGVFVLTPLAWLDKRPGVTIRRHSAQLGSGVRRQLRRRAHHRLLHGVRDDVRLHASAGQGRRGDRQYRRRPHARLRRARRDGHDHAVHARRAVQLDGFDRRGRRDDLDHRSRQGHSRCGCRSWCSSTWCSSIRW